MKTIILDLEKKENFPKYLIEVIVFVTVLTLYPLNSFSQENNFSSDSSSNKSISSGIIYQNPRVYNVKISFEIIPDSAKIDRDQDLKVWIPIPREWDSQKNVQIISIQPEPHSQYIDPEYGNKIFYWDFGKYPEKPSYQINIQARLLSYDVHTIIDTASIKPYDKTSREYDLYTKSGHTIQITPKVRELAKAAIGCETNPYLQAKKILSFVHRKIRYYQGMNRNLGQMLSTAKIDENSRGEYFTGDCTHYSALFVALCRSVGIPARCIYGRIGWVPFLNESNSKMYSKLDTVLTDNGFAGAQHHGLTPHMWAEFFLPDYGWIPVEPTAGQFGQLHNYKVIMTKGRDIILGPDAPQEHHNGYGYQWVPIYNGRVEGLLSAVWNIGKIRHAISRVYHTLDPFPADDLANYKSLLLSADKNSETILKWRNRILSEIDYHTRNIPNRNMEFSKISNENAWIRSLQYEYDDFVCHMLHKIMGDEKFFRLSREYEILLTNSSTPIETSQFIQMAGYIYGESLEWFFNQWEKTNGLPYLKLDKVKLEKDDNCWKIKGKLIQSGSKFFILPVEFSLETEKGQELFTIWQRERITDFEYQTVNRPLGLKVDPNSNILKLQKMPLQLSLIWDSYPHIILVYGTVSESEANRTAAERFNDEYLGLNAEIVKADTSVTDKDLKSECVVLFGRPATNKISKRFENLFPIKFNRDNFIYSKTNYAKTSQGLAQIIEHPLQPKGQFILYAGLSATAMLQFGNLYLYDDSKSFLIYDGDIKINSGDWETDADLIWNFD